MGTEFTVKCRKCGHKFQVSSGGGFFFHLLHCDSCGKDKSITFDQIGEAHLKYLKGFKGPYCIASSEHDKNVRDNYLGNPISEKEYHETIEKIAGKCKCGGHFRLNATARCPKCKSDDFEETDGPFCCYD